MSDIKKFSNQGASEAFVVGGEVKWFDLKKGFGFLISDQVSNDILLHENVLRNFGRNSVAEGAKVTVRVQRSSRGFQAVEIIDISMPVSSNRPPITDIPEETARKIDALAVRPARVKWFDKVKGFGFANIFGCSDDVFLHIEVLQHSGFSDLEVGEAIGLRVVNGPRGLLAAQVTSWDLAITADFRVIDEADDDLVSQLNNRWVAA